jgi:hypothetical protein
MTVLGRITESPFDNDVRLAIRESRAARMGCFEAAVKARALRSANQELRGELREAVLHTQDLALRATATIASGPSVESARD